jgi:ACS family glucarate transporter-like MFS transporter
MSRTTPAGTTPLTSEPAWPSWGRWQILAILVSYSFMTWFNRVSISVAYDERIKAEYDISPEQIGWVYSAFLFFYMVCMTPGGWLIDRYGPWLALVVMGFGSALFGALTAITGHPAVAAGGPLLVLALFFIIRSLMGALTAPVYPASSRVVLHWLPMAQRAGANGLVQGAAALGIASTFYVFGALIDWLDWPAAFLVSGACTALLALVWTVCGANDPSGHRWPRSARLDPVNQPPPAPAPSLNDDQTGIVAVRRGLPVPIAHPMPDAHAEHAPEVPLWRHRSLILLTIAYGTVSYVE